MDDAPALEALNARLPDRSRLTEADLRDDLALYGAIVNEYSVLIRGNDTRFENSVDTRRVVTPPRRA